jgi:hypothetical protein
MRCNYPNEQHNFNPQEVGTGYIYIDVDNGVPEDTQICPAHYRSHILKYYPYSLDAKSVLPLAGEVYQFSYTDGGGFGTTEYLQVVEVTSEHVKLKIKGSRHIYQMTLGMWRDNSNLCRLSHDQQINFADE